jgi:hypothetical protein
LTDIICSGSFWQGFANGFAPQTYLTTRCPYRHLAELDTIEYAWNAVGNCLDEAMDDFAVTHEREAGIIISGTQPKANVGQDVGHDTSCERYEPSSLTDSG